MVTLGDEARVLDDHDVLCRDGVVAGMAPSGTLAAAGARVIDAQGRVVLPGFINAHTHFYSSLVRGLGKARPSKNFREVLEHLWWRLDRALELADVRVSALLALVDAIRQGTTTVLDHHASAGAVRGSLDAIAEAVHASGLRACLCFEVSDRDGARVCDEALAENAAFAARCASGQDPHLRALIGLHASFTLSDATLRRAEEIASRAGVGLHVHVAEAASDQEACLEAHRCRVVERLHRLGILGERTIAAHCVHVDAGEMELLARSGTAVAHCPQSNLNNAVGIADTLAMRQRGVLVGLGTDAMTNRMLEELRSALWVRHLAAADPSAGLAQTCALLLDGNRGIAGRLFPGLGLGELREGGAADLVVIDYQPPTPLHHDTLLGHLVFGISQAVVDTTVCAGRVLMAGRRLEIALDEAALAATARACAAALWARF